MQITNTMGFFCIRFESICFPATIIIPFPKSIYILRSHDAGSLLGPFEPETDFFGLVITRDVKGLAITGCVKS